jgi:vacuolar-type H+-ATPase subunit H
MTQDEIIEMAEQSNLLDVIDSIHYDTKNWVEEAIAFAKLIAAKEREACAKVCDELQDVPATEPHHCAEDIRARGERHD